MSCFKAILFEENRNSFAIKLSNYAVGNTRNHLLHLCLLALATKHWGNQCSA